MRSTTTILAAALLCGVIWLCKPHGRQTSHDAGNAVAIEPVQTEAQSPSLIPFQDLPDAKPAGSTDSVEKLCEEGKFQQALGWAKNAEDDNRDDQLRIVFSRWAQTNPLDAMESLTEITDETVRTALFRVVANVWSADNPASLANYAITLSPGDDQTYAFNKATDNWSLQDPATIGDWLNSLPPNPEFDRAIAALIAKTDTENRSPEIAMTWVEGINDPELRRKSLEIVAEQWAETDLSAAEKYIKAADWLTSAQRAEILPRLAKPKKLAYED